MRRNAHRGGLALLAALALLLATATPASASEAGKANGTILGGEMVITQDGADDLDFLLGDPPEDDVCDPWFPPEVELYMNKKADPWEVEIQDVNFPKAHIFNDSDQTWYQLELELGPFSNSGTIDPTTDDWEQDVSLVGTVHNLGPDVNGEPSTCAKTQLSCVVVVGATLEGEHTDGDPQYGVLSTESPAPIMVDPFNCPSTVIEGQFDGQTVEIEDLWIEINKKF